MDGRNKARAESAKLSIAAGKSLGKMLFRNYPGWSENELFKFVDTLHPKSPMQIRLYKVSVVAGFTESKNSQTGNTPLLTAPAHTRLGLNCPSSRYLKNYS